MRAKAYCSLLGMRDLGPERKRSTKIVFTDQKFPQKIVNEKVADRAVTGPYPTRGLNLGLVEWKCDKLPLSHWV
ncbi:hypothetical protein TNCV_1065751 [Trichonephila clavipes]|nr:hypothetical protein TNCV_1065751 [Trichonephila clavipes]